MIHQGMAYINSWVKRHMDALIDVPREEAIVIHLVEALVSGRPHYVAHVLAFLSEQDREQVNAALFGADAPGERLKALYFATCLPAQLYSLFEIAAKHGLDSYRQYGGPFEAYRTGITAARVLSTNAVDNIHISETSWQRLIGLLGR